MVMKTKGVVVKFWMFGFSFLCTLSLWLFFSVHISLPPFYTHDIVAHVENVYLCLIHEFELKSAFQFKVSSCMFACLFHISSLIQNVSLLGTSLCCFALKLDLTCEHSL